MGIYTVTTPSPPMNSLSFPPLKFRPLAIAQAAALFCVTGCAFAQSSTAETVVVTGRANRIEAAPSAVSLEALSPQSIVGESFIRNFLSPVADYTQSVSMTPGAFGYSPNGVGLGDTKVTIRGLSDSNFNISFDGIPFNDTNGVSHHSWTFFPSPFLGGAVVDRSPGTAASIGQATYGGSIDLRSRPLSSEKKTSLGYSRGSWKTQLTTLEHETGVFGAANDSRLMLNIHKMQSDGYQTYNYQDREGLSVKFQKAISADTTMTVFASMLELKSNTPNIKGVSRANVQAGNYTAMLSGDSTKANYYGYNFYDVPSDFSYLGFNSRLGEGWQVENKTYRYSYHNKQNYNNSTTAITASSGIDKLNTYITYGNLFRASRDSSLGTLRLGLWIDSSDSHRYQVPAQPAVTAPWVQFGVPNFYESYTTTTLQPYIEHEFKVGDQLSLTPGVKLASYHQSFIHRQDNGGAVGTLGGVLNKTTNTITGGAPSISNEVSYRDVLPSISAQYRPSAQLTTYAQYSWGDAIPSTSIFDVPNAKVTPNPKPQLAKASQAGAVWSSGNLSAAADVYQIRLDGAYSALPPDANGNIGYVLSGTINSKGLEGELSYVLGGGWSVYANATVGTVKYASTGKWVAGAPADTEKLALAYQDGAWAAQFQLQRVGKMFNDGKAPCTNECFAIDPSVTANVFVNYVIAKPFDMTKSLKLQLGVTNLGNRHDIVGIASPATGSTGTSPSTSDLLTITPARSISMTATLTF